MRIMEDNESEHVALKQDRKITQDPAQTLVGCDHEHHKILMGTEPGRPHTIDVARSPATAEMDWWTADGGCGGG